jgi:transcriptional regulator with XRE-family HTH domain
VSYQSAMPRVPERPRTRAEELLRSRGLSQSEVSRLAGWSQSYLNRVVTGKSQLTTNSRSVLARVLRYSEATFHEPIGARIPEDPPPPGEPPGALLERLDALVTLLGGNAAALIRYLLAADFGGLPPKLAVRLRRILNGRSAP